jgi:hypothetical protein
VGVARKRGARDVPGDAHDHFVARATSGQFECSGLRSSLRYGLCSVSLRLQVGQPDPLASRIDLR